jgi:dihydroorotate dehydrogenase electron transfer subunit
MKYIQGEYEIVNSQKLTDTIYDITVSCPEMVDLAVCGQFVHIRCGEKILRRPISICGIDKKNGTLRLIYEVRGEGTLWLSKQNVGSVLDIMGPLGNGFKLDSVQGKVLFVGGGIGVPPLLEASKNFAENACAIILEDDFKNICQDVYITTDDGSYGHHGLVTHVLKEKLSGGEYSCVFACGPTPMLKAICVLSEEYGVECQVSLEERMGCGVGACLVCACKTKKNGVENMSHVCKDGPVFASKEVVW